MPAVFRFGGHMLHTVIAHCRDDDDHAHDELGLGHASFFPENVIHLGIIGKLSRNHHFCISTKLISIEMLGTRCLYIYTTAHRPTIFLIPAMLLIAVIEIRNIKRRFNCSDSKLLLQLRCQRGHPIRCDY